MERQTNAKQQQTYWTVIVKDGEVVDRDLHRIAPSVRHSCGHNHRTEEAAIACRTHLREAHCGQCGRSIPACLCSSPRRVESAKWYNSTIHEHARDSMAYV